MNDRKLESLQRIPLLSECSDADLRTIASTADVVMFEAGDVLRAESSTDHSFFLVLSGAAAVGASAVLTAGGWDGAVGLLGGEMETDEVRMLSDGCVLVAGPREFSGLIASVPSFAMAIGKVLTQRLREQHRRNYEGFAA